jgi:hypothetical protein
MTYFKERDEHIEKKEYKIYDKSEIIKISQFRIILS